MLVYFAHPIDQVGVDSAFTPMKRMVASVSSALLSQGISAFRPNRAYAIATGDSTFGEAIPDPDDLRVLDSINRMALFESNGVVAVIAPGVATLGVPAEIEAALTLNRALCIVTTRSLAVSSAQIHGWQERGAQVRLVSEEGTWFDGQPPSFIDALSVLPDPTRLLSVDESTSDHPSLIVKRISSNAKMPSRAYRGDAGLDLAVIGEHALRPFEYTMLPTGIQAAVPDGWWGFMTGRSSAWAKHRIRVNTAVIDSGYRGELMVGVTWMPDRAHGSELTVQPGTRFAQYVLLPAFMGDIKEADKLPDHERGTNGYGSSGH